MDAFAVSIVAGTMYQQLHVKHALRMAAFFGGFQAVMPLVGFMAAAWFKDHIQPFDHWVAFLLLCGIGSKMIYESRQFKQKRICDISSLLVLLALAFATSIDALAIGMTLSLVTQMIITAVLIIGAVTFALSITGVYLGKNARHFFEDKVEATGGLFLILLGVKILIGHLFF